jgi:hypothetical protein
MEFHGSVYILLHGVHFTQLLLAIDIIIIVVVSGGGVIVAAAVKIATVIFTFIIPFSLYDC